MNCCARDALCVSPLYTPKLSPEFLHFCVVPGFDRGHPSSYFLLASSDCVVFALGVYLA